MSVAIHLNHLVGIEEVEQENMAAMKLLEELPKGARSRKEFTDDNTRFLEAQQ